MKTIRRGDLHRWRAFNKRGRLRRAFSFFLRFIFFGYDSTLLSSLSICVPVNSNLAVVRRVQATLRSHAHTASLLAFRQSNFNRAMLISAGGRVLYSSGLVQWSRIWMVYSPISIVQSRCLIRVADERGVSRKRKGHSLKHKWLRTESIQLGKTSFSTKNIADRFMILHIPHSTRITVSCLLCLKCIHHYC